MLIQIYMNLIIPLIKKQIKKTDVLKNIRLTKLSILPI
jgi:hypothetical protein